MSKEIKLAGMMGKTHQHKGTNQIYFFQSFNKNGDEIIVATDKEWLNTTVYDLNVFMNNYLPVKMTEGEVVVIKKPETVGDLPALKTIQADTITMLRDTLMENISKVKADAAYIPQAKEIGNNINAIINLARTEIEMKTKL